MTLDTPSGALLRAATHTLSGNRPPFDRPNSPWGLSFLLTAAALLTACGTTPLPTWPKIVKIPPPTAQRTPPVLLPTAHPFTAQNTGPETAAVAARFPDLGTHYATPGLAVQRQTWTTNAEATQWLRDVTMVPLPMQAALLTLGTSQRGEPLHALVLTKAKGTDPDSLLQSNRPTVLLIGQQHGDEPASSEALLIVAQELAQGALAPLLDQINVVIVPRANPDGAQAGTRATANGIDMGHDHLLLNTPEAQALAVLARNYHPVLVIDAQEYPWAGEYLQKFHVLPRNDALLQYAGTANVHEFLTKASREWFYEPMAKALEAQGLTSDWYHTPSGQPGELRLAMGGTQPDTARNVNGLKNAASLLVAVRGTGLGRNHIQRRVHTQVTAIGSALHSTAERAASLGQVRSFVARETEAQVCKNQIALTVGMASSARDITALDPETGADQALNVPWSSALNLRTVQSRARPCGYWLAPSAATAVERLRLLGVQVLRVAESGTVLADAFQKTTREPTTSPDTTAPAPAPAPAPMALVRSTLDAPAGSFYVPLNQPLAHLAVAALEADMPGSYFSHRLVEGLADTARVMTTPSLVFDDLE